MSAKGIFLETKEGIRNEVEKLAERNITPGLAAVVAEDDETAKMYVSLKSSDCKEVGIYSEPIEIFGCPKEEREDLLIRTIKKLNERDDITGILVQKPLPSFIREHRVFGYIDPSKDVDGLTPYNKGRLMSDFDIERDLLPCTAVGVCRLLDRYNVSVEGMNVAIVGRSDLVGRPLRVMLERRNATPSCIHRATRDKTSLLRQADMIISAAGRPPEMYDLDPFRLKSEMIKERSVVVGIGVRKNPQDGKLYFDLPDQQRDSDEYRKIAEKASYLTPNLNGIGLMTRGRLLMNTINATKALAARGLV